MAADHLQFLKERFIREFHEAEEEFTDKFPLHPQFQDIEKFLQERSISPSTPIEMKNGLYDLLYELKECYMLAEKERNRQKERDSRIQSMKSRFDVHAYKIKTRLMTMPTIVKKRWFIYTTRKKLLRIKRNLELLKDDAAAAAEISLWLSDTIKVWNPSWLYSVPKIHGFDNELQKIRALLLENAYGGGGGGGGIKAVGIVGMSGIGKTTLARTFVNSFGWRVFKPIIWVTLSRSLNPSEIMRQLLETLRDKDAQATNHDALPEQLRDLHNRLSNKKYLIVLDNVLHPYEWYSDLGSNLQTDGNISHLCHGLPKGGGGAIIVTSRFEELATRMVGEQNLIKLQPLFDAEALWSMFMDSIQRKEFLTSNHHQRLSRMKEEIIDRCDGLPLAAKTLAEVLSTQIGKEEYWSILDIPKKFCLRVDQLEPIFYYEAKKKVRILPGVKHVSGGPNVGEITIIGRCLPVEMVRELGKLCHIELISVKNISDNVSFLHWHGDILSINKHHLKDYPFSLHEELETRMVGEQNLFKLQPVYVAETVWSMFMNTILRKKFLTSRDHQMLSRMEDKIIDRCDGLPLAARTMAEVFSIQLGKEEYWSIVDVRKKFCLRLDQLDAISYNKAMKNLRTLPGVEDVTDGPNVGETTIIGRCLPVEIAKELGKLCYTELISIEDISDKKYMVLELGLHNNKEEEEAKKIVSKISGFESFAMDMNEKKLTVFGDVDPEEVVSKLCNYWHVDILSIGPVEQHLKDEKNKNKQHLKEKNKQRILGQLINQLNDLEKWKP